MPPAIHHSPFKPRFETAPPRPVNVSPGKFRSDTTGSRCFPLCAFVPSVVKLLVRITAGSNRTRLC